MNWKTEVIEVSNNVYKLVMTHTSGSVIEKIGTDIELMKIEAIDDSIQIEKEIEKKIKSNHKNC